jgi:hypothetical protein
MLRRIEAVCSVAGSIAFAGSRISQYDAPTGVFDMPSALTAAAAP